MPSTTIMSSNLKLPENNQRLESFGCKLSAGGAHNSRTMMLDEMSRLLNSGSDSASADEYRKAILENNILGKGTITTRAKTYRYLRELYALSDQVPMVAPGPSPRFEVQLDNDILEVISDVFRTYGAMSNAEIKIAVYRTEPMRFILQEESKGKKMVNKPVLYKDKTARELSE